MKINKEDRRIQYTKMIIKESFFELLEKNNINKITVTQLCNVANVNRTTFYKYYLDIYDLLKKIEAELYEKFEYSINNCLTFSTINEFTQNIFNVIYENKDICKILINNNGDKDFIKKVFYLAHDRFIQEWNDKWNNLNSEDFEYLFSYMANGSIGIIQEWVKNNYSESPKYIANIVWNLNNYNLQQYNIKNTNKNH